jgi:hypothetical protein
VVGPVSGVVTIRMTGFGWEGAEKVIAVTGTAVPRTFRLAPAKVEFRDQGIGTTGPPVVVRAVNTSSRVLRFEASIASPVPDNAVPARPVKVKTEVEEDFVVTGAGGGAATCKAVKPRASCRFLVSLRPSSLDPSIGQLQVVSSSTSVELTQYVDLAGETASPVVDVSPTVAREGRVVFATGSNFLPGQPLLFLWSGGGAVFPVVIPDTDGKFTAPVVILRDRDTGTHQLTVTMPGIGTFEAPPVIVVPGSLQPPDFATRN